MAYARWTNHVNRVKEGLPGVFPLSYTVRKGGDGPWRYQAVPIIQRSPRSISEYVRVCEIHVTHQLSRVPESLEHQDCPDDLVSGVPTTALQPREFSSHHPAHTKP